MELSSEQLIELVETIGQQHSALRPNDRRTHVRIGLRYRLNIRRLMDHAGPGGRKHVYLRDLSVGGVGLSATFRLADGEGFVIELPRKDGTCHEVICMVTHVKSMAGGVFHIGGRFIAPFEPSPKRTAKMRQRR